VKPRRYIVVLIGALVYAAGASIPPASGAASPVGVKTTNLDEFLPSAGMDSGTGDSYFAWSQNSNLRHRHYNAFLDVTSGSTTSTVRLNAKGTLGWGSGIDDGRLVFQEVRRTSNGKHQSNLVFYDIPSATRLPSPDGVNTRAWQWGPSISGDWILYGENSRPQDFSHVILHNTTTREERILAASTFERFTVFQDQVTGDYAVYHKHTPRRSNVIVYQISTGKRTRVPNPNDRFNVSAAVTADGTVYYARSGKGCGNHVRLYRWSPVTLADPVLLLRLPDGMDVAQRLFAFNDGVSTVLYFDRESCRTRNSNIYRIDNADTA